MFNLNTKLAANKASGKRKKATSLKDSKKIDTPQSKNGLFFTVYHKFTSFLGTKKRKPSNKVSNEKTIISIINEKQDADIWKLPPIDHHRFQPELEELLFIKNKPEKIYQSKKQESSLLSMQLNKKETDKIKEKLQSDAIKRNIIKANRLREQRDIALFETLSLFSNDEYYKSISSSNNNENPILMINNNQMDHTRNFDDEHQVHIW